MKRKMKLMSLSVAMLFAFISFDCLAANNDTLLINENYKTNFINKFSSTNIHKKSSTHKDSYFIKANDPTDENSYGEGRSAIKKSIILAGWGIATTTKDKMAGIKTGVTCYGLLALGIGGNMYSNIMYKNYQNIVDPNEFLKTTAKTRISRIKGVRYAGIACLVGSAVCYIDQILKTRNWAKKNEYYKKRAKIWKDNLAFNLDSYYDNTRTGLALNISYKF